MSDDLRHMVDKLSELLPGILSSPSEIGAANFRTLGYHRLIIAITDTDTGQETSVQIYRKPEDVPAYIDELRRSAFPVELQKQQGMSLLEPDGTEIKETHVRAVIARQILSDGRPKGISKTTQKRHDKIWTDWQQSRNMSEDDFCRKARIHRRTLIRIIEEHSRKM